MTLEEKMRRVRQLKGSSPVACLSVNGNDIIVSVNRESDKELAIGDTIDAALDALLAKLEPPMTVEECWRKLKKNTTAAGEPIAIKMVDWQYEVWFNGWCRTGDTLREAYRKLAEHFGWKE